MSLDLYAFSGSPFVWCVQLALEHKGIDYTMRPLSPAKGDNRTDTYLAMNPNGKVPTIDHDGFVLYESSVICEYLEERFPDAPRLLPDDVQARALVRRRVADVHTELFPGAFRIAQNVYFKPKEEWDLAVIDGARELFGARLGLVESDIGGDYQAGDALTLADFALYPQLAHIARYELRKPDLGLSDRIGPKTRAWMDRIEALPYFERTYPPHWRK